MLFEQRQYWAQFRKLWRVAENTGRATDGVALSQTTICTSVYRGPWPSSLDGQVCDHTSQSIRRAAEIPRSRRANAPAGRRASSANFSRAQARAGVPLVGDAGQDAGARCGSIVYLVVFLHRDCAYPSQDDKNFPNRILFLRSSVGWELPGVRGGRSRN